MRLDDLPNKVTRNIRKALPLCMQDEIRIEYTKEESEYDAEENIIYLNKGDRNLSDVLAHEVGHYIDLHWCASESCWSWFNDALREDKRMIKTDYSVKYVVGQLIRTRAKIYKSAEFQDIIAGLFADERPKVYIRHEWSYYTDENISRESFANIVCALIHKDAHTQKIYMAFLPKSYEYVRQALIRKGIKTKF